MSRENKTLVAAFIASIYFFLIMTGYYIIKPLRDSSFLSSYGPQLKPVFNIICMILLVFLSSQYSKLLKKRANTNFYKIFFGLIVGCLLIFRFFFPLFPTVTGTLFYFWLACANVFWVTLFWTQVNVSFGEGKHKFYYILIALGGTIGGAIGGKMSSLIVPHIGADNLLLVGSFFFLLSFFMAEMITDLTGKRALPEEREKLQRATFRNVAGEKYALCLLIIVVVGTFVQSIYDYQLAVFVKNSLENSKDVFSVFFGNLYFKMNMYSIFAEIVLAPIVLYTIGAGRGMYLLIVLIFGTNALLKLDHSLIIMEWVFIFFAGSGYSIIQIFREQLYIPTSDCIKISYKSFIDTVGFKMGDVFAAVIILANVWLFKNSFNNLSIVINVLGVIAFITVIIINRLHHKLLHNKKSKLQRNNLLKDKNIDKKRKSSLKGGFLETP